LRFSVRAKHRKMLSTENGFLKNDFPETILRRNKRSIRTRKNRKNSCNPSVGNSSHHSYLGPKPKHMFRFLIQN